MTPPLGFSTLTPRHSSNELPPITVSTFTAITAENTSLNNRASTSAKPDLMISHAFIEANYEILKSLLGERQMQIRNKGLRTKLKYFSKECDEEREMESRPVRIREPPQFYDGGRVERNFEGRRPSGLGANNNRSQGMNLPLLLAAQLGMSENGHRCNRL
uniref:Uncharacterized protein n=1 Tax=Tanacetum cinerariifolium TaxID=118510 RepID=A0A699SKA4_TANCI|nr:hypothetical protein [Tanacetum cinerariifolium]